MPLVEISDEAYAEAKRRAAAKGAGVSELLDALILEGAVSAPAKDDAAEETRAPKPFIPVRGREHLAQKCQDWLKTRER